MTDRDIDRVDGQRDLPGWGVRVLSVAWPSFLAACILETLVFAFVDPHDLSWAGAALTLSRQTVYSLSFFAFWVVAAAACTLSVVLDKQPAAKSSAV